MVGGFNFRLGTYNVPEGSSANPYGEVRSAEFDGTGGTGWPDRTVDQKGPLKFFILCRYRDKVYTYLYEIKIVTNIVMGMKI